MVDLPLWGRGTIRRMVDEVKNRWQAICFRSNLTHRKRSPLPKGEGHLASLENEETHR